MKDLFGNQVTVFLLLEEGGILSRLTKRMWDNGGGVFIERTT
jgi:hypothetical protein